MMDEQTIQADATTIPALVALRDATRIQAAIKQAFGDTASLQYCVALVAFVDATEAHVAELARRLAELEPTPDDMEAMLR